MDKQYKHLFGWGDTRGLRALMTQENPFLLLLRPPIETFGYPPHAGNPELVSNAQAFIRALTGLDYQYLVITSGATQAINAAIHAMKETYTEYLACRKLYFPFYPGIANKNGLILKNDDALEYNKKAIRLIDSPANPTGAIHENEDGSIWNAITNIWDSCYHSPTYNIPNNCSYPKHLAMVGSFAKISGINGIRIGWLATESKEVYDSAVRYVSYDTVGVSQADQWLANKMIKEVNWSTYLDKSKRLIEDNKDEFMKLSRLFSDQPMPKVGMFYFAEVDQGLRDLFEKASVQFMDGRACGADYDSVRVNLANSREDTKKMVKEILKNDKI